MTFLYQKVFPTLWITGLGIGTLTVWFIDGASGGDPSVKYVFPFLWIAGSAIIFWFTGQIYSVQRQGDCLVVWRFFKQHEIPLDMMDEVTETRFWSPKLIKIRFKAMPGVPEQIKFIAPVALQVPLGTHPSARKLRELTQTRKDT